MRGAALRGVVGSRPRAVRAEVLKMTDTNVHTVVELYENAEGAMTLCMLHDGVCVSAIRGLESFPPTCIERYLTCAAKYGIDDWVDDENLMRLTLFQGKYAKAIHRMC